MYMPLATRPEMCNTEQSHARLQIITHRSRVEPRRHGNPPFIASFGLGKIGFLGTNVGGINERRARPAGYGKRG